LSDRKYRHQGYQDSGGYSKSSGGSRPQTPRPEPQYQRMEGAPRGRTAGGFGPEVFKCNACGTQRIGLEQPSHDEVCVKCAADLHTCGNCRAFDTTTLWECRENIPARVSGKHARNQCTFFQPKVVRDLTADKARQPQTPDDARKAFDALFKK
jgi:recombinational DNA repair protein (RecF pathway)